MILFALGLVLLVGVMGAQIKLLWDLVPLFLGFSKKDIFDNGPLLDSFFRFRYTFLLWLLKYIGPATSTFIPLHFRIAQILLLDQVSRHVYRNQPQMVALYTILNRPLLEDFYTSKNKHSLKILAYISLASRH